jgi:vancomycin permeability regulator SanA
MIHGLVFAYGQEENGELKNQTKSRCQKAVELYHEHKVDKLYVTAHASLGGVQMSNKMRDFLVEHGVKAEDIVVDTRGGNTAGEIDVFKELAPKNEEYAFISSSYHLRRIRFLASKRFARGKFELYAAKDVDIHFLLDFLMEYLKQLKAFLRPIASSIVHPHPLP